MPLHSPPPTIHEGRRASMPALSNTDPAAHPTRADPPSSDADSAGAQRRRRRRTRTPSPESMDDGRADLLRPRAALSRTPSLSGLAGSVREWGSEQGEKLARFLGQDSDGPEPRAFSTAKPSHRPNAGKTAMLDTLRASIANWPSLAGVPSLASLLPALGPHQHDGHMDDESEDSDAEGEEAHHQQHHQSTAAPDAIDRLTGNVVMLGGYRGSILRDAKTGKRLWFSLKIAFGVHKPDLSIGLSEEDELRTEETIVPGKMLTTLVGFLDSGRSLARRLKARQYATGKAQDGHATGAPPDANAGAGAVTLHSFGYDWRRNLDLSSAKLLDKLTALKNDSGEGATVFAHSMGGLVVLHALATAPDPTVFKAVVLAGAPLNGCINILGPLRLGDGDITSPAVAFSCRSAFYFLPFGGRCFERKDGTRLDLDLHDRRVWSEYGLSPVMEGVLDPDGPEKVAKRERARKAMALSKARAWMGIGGLPVPGELGMDQPANDDEPSAPGPHGLEAQASHPEPTAVDKTTDAAIVDYFDATMARVHKFHADIAGGFDEEKLAGGLYPPVALMAADNAPTVRGAIASSLEKIKRPHKNPFNKFLFADGDGVVCESPLGSAERCESGAGADGLRVLVLAVFDSANHLPGEWNRLNKGVVKTKAGHVCMLSDLDAVRKALELVDGSA